MKLTLLCILLCLLAACGKSQPQKSSTTKQKVSSFFSASSLKIDVYYEPGAEPYTSDIVFQYWSLLETNLKALFQGRSHIPLISVPKTLDEMKQIPASGDVSWTVQDVLDLDKKHAAASNATTFNIYFVNGFAADGNNIIGFHISDTRVIVVFKDVIRSTDSDISFAAVPKYVEQATIIHEMGHALGLVNNGIKMVDDHQDKEHGAHCSNPNCVMYYSNEGTSGLVNLVKKIIQTQDTVMFDDMCLKDTRSF